MPPQYILDIGFDDINLKAFLTGREKSTPPLTHRIDQPGRQDSVRELQNYSTGTMDGALSLAGIPGRRQSRTGQCRLKITDMKVGKLSPLAKLLYVLKLTKPRDFAFEGLLLDSYIKAEQLLVKKIDLSGDALAFTGSGSINLPETNVNLTLAARGRRLATAEPSLLQSLTEGLSPAVARIEVAGNLYDPDISVKTLPIFKDSLKVLGSKE